MKRKVTIVLVVLLWIVSYLPRIDGQSETGSITGIVTDSVGNQIPGAFVSLVEVHGKLAVESRSNKSGQYSFSGVEPGRYVLFFYFKNERTQQVQTSVTSGAQVRLDFTLPIVLPPPPPPANPVLRHPDGSKTYR